MSAVAILGVGMHPWGKWGRPAAPACFIWGKGGRTWVIRWMMMEAGVYGRVPSAKTVKRDNAPPENMLNRLRMPPCWPWNSCASCSGLLPGTGMCAPIR